MTHTEKWEITHYDVISKRRQAEDEYEAAMTTMLAARKRLNDAEIAERDSLENMPAPDVRTEET